MMKLIARSRAAPAMLWLAILLFGVGNAGALSLRSARAEAFLGDVRPGSAVVLSSAAGNSLFVENAGGEPVELAASLEIPPAGRLRDGYEPLPDPKWVSLKGARWTLAPGGRADPEIVVTVPKERRLTGGQFQFDCLYRGRAPGGSDVALRTVVTFAVGDGSPEEVPRGGGSLVVSPVRARVEGVALGRRVAANSDGSHALKLANAGESRAIVRLTPARTWDESVRLEDGYTPAPNPNWLKTGPPISVAAGTVAEAALELEIPGQARYRGRKWAFVVAVDSEQGGRRGRSWWTLYVRTSDREEISGP